MTGKTSP